MHGLEREYVARVHAVTPEEVQRIANEYLKDDQMTIVIVGDRSALESQLQGIAPIAQ